MKLLQYNRISVATFFAINGFLYGNWTARLPQIQQFYGVSHAELGSILFMSALGAIIAMPFAGWVTTKFGSKMVTVIGSLLLCSFIPFLPLYSDPFIAGALFFIIGLCSGAMDIAMNGQAVFVERAWGKPIMSSFHAVFSIGMAVGAGSGALFSRYEITLSQHFLLIAILGFILSVVASFYLVSDKEEQKTVTEKDAGTKQFLPTKAIIPLGIIAFCGMTGEGSMADWSAIFMKKVVGQTDEMSALGFASFAIAMTIGRLFGDKIIERYGNRQILIWDSIIATFGLALVLFFATTWAAFIGFFLVGLGLATVVPIIYSSAGNTEGVSPSVGIAMATTIGYTGFFVGPPTIGFIADSWGLRIGLGFTLLLFVLMLFLIQMTVKKEKSNN